MSHELLLIAGVPSGSAADRRRDLVARAAALVPGVSNVQVDETRHACVALVATDPPDGDVATMVGDGRSCRATVALTTSGLRVAGTEERRLAGSESGHVHVAVTEDGVIDVTTDGFATVGTYWAKLGEELLLSTHLASLVSLGLAGDLDEQGALEYLGMLHPLGGRTTLRSASLLQPGSSLSWERGHCTLDDRSIFVPGAPHGDTKTTVAGFGAVWRRVVGDAVERADTRRVAIGLSGGLDSRIIAAEWVRSNRHPIAYTYGDASSYEARVASLLAGRLSLPHLRVPIADENLLPNADAIARRLDGAHSPSQMYELWWSGLLRSVTDVVVNGLGGGTLMGDDKLMGIRGLEGQAQRAWARYAGDVTAVEPFVSSDVRDDMASVVRSSITESLREWNHLDRTDSGIYWRVANRQFRWGNMFHSAMRRIGIRPDTPFLDGRFLDFAARLTPEQRLNGALYLAAQQQLFPETADVPRSDDGNGPAHLQHAYWSGDRRFVVQLAELGSRHPISAMRRAYRRGVDVSARRAARLTALTGLADELWSRKDVFPADVFLRTRDGYARRLADGLEGAKGSTTLFDDGEIEAAVNAIRSGDRTLPATALGKVAALGAWATDYRRRADDRNNVPSA